MADPDIEITSEGFADEPTTMRMSYASMVDALAERTIKPFAIEGLTDAERLQEHLWSQVYRGGQEAIVACRELLAQSAKPAEIRTEFIYVEDGRKLKYVVCDQRREQWLTPSGVGYMRADEAIVFDTEIAATQALSAYRRNCESSDVKLLVKEIGV